MEATTINHRAEQTRQFARNLMAWAERAHLHALKIAEKFEEGHKVTLDDWLKFREADTAIGVARNRLFTHVRDETREVSR